MGNSKYELITETVIKALENGTVPWRKPFAGESMAPRNFVSKRRYSGSNVFLLVMAGYDAPYWLTFNQAQKLGGTIRKGEHGTIVSFFNFKEVDDIDADGKKITKRIPILGTRTVFNIEQTDGIKYEVPVPNFDVTPIESAELIVQMYEDAPTVKNVSGIACYRPSTDTISIPTIGEFTSPEDYYSTLFHELGHSTGHESRLDREIMNGFGDEKYSREELVAEMTAMFLCSECGLEVTHDNSAAYIGSWIKALQNDHRMVIWAAGRAQKAANLILGADKVEEG